MSVSVTRRPIESVRGTSEPCPGHEEAVLLRISHVTKRFGGVPAARDVDLSLRQGEILGLVGENGAGKTTVMKVIAGVYESGVFEGTVSLDGVVQTFHGVRDAERVGIVMIAQELQIAPHLSIAENMFAGSLPSRRGLVDRRALHTEARRWLSFFDIKASPGAAANVLSPSQQRLMLIAAALSKRARVLVMDEPTAALTDAEADVLFGHLKRLAADGVGIIFITHRLDEIDRIADRILVMRNGSLVAEFPKAPPRRELVHSMLGRDMEAQTVRDGRRSANGRPAVLSIERLSVVDPQDESGCRVSEVSLELRPGEIVGLYGLVGAGRTELLNAVFGSWLGPVAGRVHLDGAPYEHRSPVASLQRGLALLTEDRKATGNLAGLSVRVNLSAASLGSVSRGGIIGKRAEWRRSKDLIERLDVRPNDSAKHIDRLSGGNQQKVLLGRALAARPSVLLLDEPTLGVDIGSRFQMYQYMRELADDGLSILLSSSDVEEVHAECDRVIVMYKGRVTAVVDANCDRRELLAAATGGTDE